MHVAPPNYDEIIQIGMDDQMLKAKKERRSGRKSRLHKPRLELKKLNKKFL